MYVGEDFSQGKYHRGKVYDSVEEYSPLIWFSNRGHLVVFHLNLLSHVIADQPLEFRCKLGVEVSLDQICHSYS